MVGAEIGDDFPKTGAVIELHQVGHFMADDIFQYFRRGEDEPPGKREVAVVAATAPAGARVAQADAADGAIYARGFFVREGRDARARLALQPIA